MTGACLQKDGSHSRIHLLLLNAMKKRDIKAATLVCRSIAYLYLLSADVRSGESEPEGPSHGCSDRRAAQTGLLILDTAHPPVFEPASA